MFWRRRRFIFMRRRPLFWGCGAAMLFALLVFLVLFFFRTAMLFR